jgi:serine/threonine protein kinase
MQSDLYQPEKLLAAGPAAKIYRGIETATGRKVLIKALLENHEATHPLDRERLQMLAPSLMQIRHPQIAGLITLLPTEEEFALVYEFVPGISGRALPQEKQLSAADVRALAVQLLNALLVGEHLRQPHGDLKPSNLIIADHPGGGLFIQVQDWGLTLARSQPTPETLWFAAPELLYGAPISSQSDLFTAAASLFYLATGTAPAQGTNVEEIMADWRSFDLRGSLSVMRPDMDQPFVDWLAWLLNADPTQRAPSVAHALDALMRSMQTGFVYQQQPAPVMTPGAITGPLVTGGTSTTMPRAPAPRPPQSGVISKPAPASPKPPGSMTGVITHTAAKTSEVSTAPASEKPKGPAKKRIGTKGIIAILLNVSALGFAAWFFGPSPEDGGWPGLLTRLSSSMSSSAETEEPPETKAEAAEGPGIKARQVWVSMKGRTILNLAEVQVFSGAENIAFQGDATQSSVEWNGTPERAIDGNTDGNFDKGSVSHTNGKNKDPVWKLKFPREVTLNTIVLWNRTDPKYSDRLKNFTVSVRDEQDKVLWQKTIKETPKPRVKVVVGE